MQMISIPVLTIPLINPFSTNCSNLGNWAIAINDFKIKLAKIYPNTI